MGARDGYELVKQSDVEFAVIKNGKFAYLLTFKNRRWSCDCPARKACRHLDLLPEEAKVKRYPRAVLTEVVDYVAYAMDLAFVAQPKWEVCGSYRRGCPDGKDVDVIVDCNESDFLYFAEVLVADGKFEREGGGTRKIYGKINGIPVDLERIDGCFASHLLYRTGPAGLNIRMRSLAKSMGLTLSEKTPAGSEEELFAMVGMKYLTPEERESFK